jgi:hypothetical protein
VRCLAGDAGACQGLAYAIQKTGAPDNESAGFYRRACLYGAAIGCTNYAASIWARDHSEEEIKCARRTFEKACTAKEPFACGMVGRLMLESTPPSAPAEVRSYLEQACADVSGFPCRVLAKHLESGDLGDNPPGLIRNLLTRACAGGDPDACGEPKTVAETFK